MISLNKSLLLSKNQTLTIATLGPAGTSSQYVAKKLLYYFSLNSTNVKLYNTYEDSYKGILLGEADLLLVANAYSKIDNFYMDENIKLLMAFIEQTPPYAIAIRQNFTPPFFFTSENKKEILIASHLHI